MGDTGYRPPQKQQLRQSIQDALNPTFPPGSHGMPVVRAMSETPPYFSYLRTTDQNSRRLVSTPRAALPILAQGILHLSHLFFSHSSFSLSRSLASILHTTIMTFSGHNLIQHVLSTPYGLMVYLRGLDVPMW